MFVSALDSSYTCLQDWFLVPLAWLEITISNLASGTAYLFVFPTQCPYCLQLTELFAPHGGGHFTRVGVGVTLRCSHYMHYNFRNRPMTQAGPSPHWDALVWALWSVLSSEVVPGLPMPSLPPIGQEWGNGRHYLKSRFYTILKPLIYVFMSALKKKKRN